MYIKNSQYIQDHLASMRRGKLAYVTWRMSGFATMGEFCNTRMVELSELGSNQFIYRFGQHVDDDVIERINDVIIQDQTMLDKIVRRHERYLLDKRANCSTSENIDESGGSSSSSSVGLEHMSGMFFGWMLGIVSSVFVAIVEAVAGKFKCKIGCVRHVGQEE